MKFILAPLMAIATFAGIVAAAAPDNEATIDFAKYKLSGPAGNCFAYWPNKKDSDPDTRVIELTFPGGSVLPYRLHYKDPKDNKFDLSDPEDAEEALAAIEEEGAGSLGDLTTDEYHARPLEDKVFFSVYLDKDDKILYLTQGPSVPSSYKDVLNQLNAQVRHMQRKLDPNTPGIEDLKDPGSIGAQMILNDLAIKGPDALDNARNDPTMLQMFDILYDSADDFFAKKADLEAKVAAEEKAEAGKKEKRHNKPHHHHKKSSQKKKNN
ncbi:hypothetical protein EC991_006724 [Linnemannia zychae]|nr:hypothetical protein EC991_006724 [Linnemannia zychae]